MLPTGSGAISRLARLPAVNGAVSDCRGLEFDKCFDKVQCQGVLAESGIVFDGHGSELATVRASWSDYKLTPT